MYCIILLPPQPSYITLLALSHIINCGNIYKLYVYHLLSLYILTRMYVFRADHLVLDSQLACSPLEKTVSPALRVL